MSIPASTHSDVVRTSHMPGTCESGSFADIHSPGVNLLIRQRSLATGLPAGLRPLVAVRAYRRVLQAAAAGNANWLQWLSEYGVHDLIAEWLAADIGDLVQRFARLNGVENINVYLETLEDDECRLFHVDCNHLRLLCTYTGPGTEWLQNDQVDRSKLGQGDNEAILVSGSPQQLRPGDIAVLKGERYPGNTGNGIVHRSPPISQQGEKRLRLRLDVPGFGGC